MNINNKLMEFYLSYETTQRSKFKKVKIGDHINLELPIKFGNKISWHICQGNVDFPSKLFSINKINSLSFSRSMSKYVGSTL